MEVGIVGGGPTGLFMALSLVVFSKFPPGCIHIFEKRRDPPSRSNFLLFNSLGHSRLEALGVLPYLLEDESIFSYSSLTFVDDALNLKISKPLLPSATTLPLNIDSISVKQMLEAQNSGRGIVVICLKDLENALRKRATALGIQMTYATCSFVLDVDGTYAIELVETKTITRANVILLAEGSKRTLSTTQLKLHTLVQSPIEHMARIDLTFTPNLSIWKRNRKDTPPQRNQILCGGGGKNMDRSVLFIGTPPHLTHVERVVFLRERTREHLKLIGQEHAEILSIANDTFSVEDAMLSKSCLRNVFVVGDAARNGHFLTGLGCQFGALFDFSCIHRVVQGLRLGKTLEEVGNAYEKEMLLAATEYFAFNLQSWYGKEKAKL